MMELLNTIDSKLLLFFNSFHCGFFDNFMSIATGRYIWLPFYLALVVMIIRNQGWKRGILWILALSLAVGLADQICASIIRPLVGRMRPSNEMNPISQFVHTVGGYRGGQFGFPSCHGSNSFALATLVCLLIKRKTVRLVITGWALLNVYSRVYLGVHYPGDLFCGAIIGICTALIVYRLMNKMIAALHIDAVAAEDTERQSEEFGSHLGLATASEASVIHNGAAMKLTVPGIVFLSTLLIIAAVAI